MTKEELMEAARPGRRRKNQQNPTSGERAQVKPRCKRATCVYRYATPTSSSCGCWLRRGALEARTRQLPILSRQ